MQKLANLYKLLQVFATFYFIFHVRAALAAQIRKLIYQGAARGTASVRLGPFLRESTHL